MRDYAELLLNIQGSCGKWWVEVVTSVSSSILAPSACNNASNVSKDVSPDLWSMSRKKGKINDSFITNKESIQKSSYGAQWNVPNPTKETVKSSLSGLQDNEAYIVIQYVPCEVCAVPKLPNRARGAVMDQQQSPECCSGFCIEPYI